MAFLFPKYFPFCIPAEEETKDIEVGSGTFYPMGMELEDAMFLFWKAKTLQCNASFTSNTSGTSGDDTYDFGGSVFINQEINSNQNMLYKWPSKMSDMICNPHELPYNFFFRAIDAGSSYATANGVPQNPTNYGDGFEIGIFSNFGSGDIITKDKKYFPRITTYLSITGSNMPEFQNFAFNATTLLPENLHTSIQKAFKMEINNRQYEANLYVQCNLGGDYILVSSAAASLVIKPNDDRLTE
jgi:hypothetical protein